MGKFDALKLAIKSRMVNIENTTVDEIEEAFREYLEWRKWDRENVNPKLTYQYYNAAWLGTDKVQRKEYDALCYMMEFPEFGQQGSAQLPLTRDVWKKSYRLRRCAEKDIHGGVHDWYERVIIEEIGIDATFEGDDYYSIDNDDTRFAWETLAQHLIFSRSAFHHPQGRTCMNFNPAVQLP